jgi:AcrR family transcriptional regulator
MSAPARRTQAERSEESRNRLLDAAIACLTERGYTRTTVQEVSRRAGLSVGCQQHHFPSKTDLMVAAMEHLYDQRRQALIGALARLPEGPEHAPALVRLLWEALSGESFQAYVELVVASRTDPALRAPMERLSHRMGDETRATFLAHFEATDVAAPYEPLLPALLFGLMEGLALSQMAMPGRPDLTESVQALTGIVPTLLAPRGGGMGSST